ncbi:uncharacterized protein DMENIID0001_063800 [Sergentomyia squamirostris]
MPTLWSTLVILMVVLVPLCLASPRPFPIDYLHPPLNLQSLATPREINDLTVETMQKAQKDVVTTISEVQKLLASDPSLPRLTRGEIADLFETVTKEEYVKSVRAGDMNRAKHMRALMLVLPYNTKNMPADNLEDLYTRPPVTRVIQSDVKPTVVEKKPTRRPEIGAKIDDFTATTYHPKTKQRKPLKADVVVTTFHPKTTFTPPDPTIPTWKSESVEPKTKFSSHYSAEVANFEEKSKPPMRENVVDLLAAIGLTPDTTSTSTTTTTPTPTTIISTTKKPELTPELEELLKSFGFLQNDPIQEDQRNFPQEETRSATYESQPFKPLPDSLAKQDYRRILSAPIQSEDFVAFKPIPRDTSKVLNDENKEFFRSFGLLPDALEEVSTDKPVSKEPKMLKMPEIDGDLPLPSSMLQALDKVGISRGTTTQKVEEITTDLPSSTTTSTTPSTTTSTTSTVLPSTSTTSPRTRRVSALSTTSKPSTTTTALPKNHRPVKVSSRARVFSLPDKDMQVPKKIMIPTKDPKQKPIEVTQEDLDHLHYLLETIQKLDKLNATISGTTPPSKGKYDVKTLLGIGPDPLNNVELELAKNEVKRQKEEAKRQADDAVITSPEPIRFSLNLTDSSSTPEVVTPVESSDSEVKIPDLVGASDTTSSTITSTTPSLLLAESFPGLDPVSENPLPPPRRTGFYFLADWNSFLEVGDGKDKVEVRFQPQVGDPSRFIPISVP